MPNDPKRNALAGYNQELIQALMSPPPSEPWGWTKDYPTLAEFLRQGLAYAPLGFGAFRGGAPLPTNAMPVPSSNAMAPAPRMGFEPAAPGKETHGFGIPDESAHPIVRRYVYGLPERGQVGTVPLRDLIALQGRVVESDIAQKASGAGPHSSELPIVARFGDRLVIKDGVHRLEALRRAGAESAQAEILGDFPKADSQ